MCTVYPIWLMIAWSIEALFTGKWPSTREAGRAWRESDGLWAAMSGEELGFRAVCLYVKPDLKEVGTSMGFAGVSTRLAPCAVCLCTQEDWDDLVGLSPLEHSWPPSTLEAYEGSCRACERRVRLDAAAYSEVRGLLDNDNRPRGAQGESSVS